jgi:hypothetical protein
LSGGATSIIKKNSELFNSARPLSLHGEINDRFAYIVLRPMDKKRLGIASLLLEVIGHGSRVKGWSSWYSNITGDIAAAATTWDREHQAENQEANEKA